jgi:uncharacterized membrane protein YjjB (DUF3815 family)
MIDWFELLIVAAFIAAFVLGLRSTLRQYRRWQRRGPFETRNRILLLLFTICALITAAAGWFGFISARRLIGFEPLPWTPVPSVLIATGIVLIPVLIDAVVTDIEAGE